jgi:hypothetical protein
MRFSRRVASFADDDSRNAFARPDHRLPRARPDAGWPLLQRRRDGLAALGAHHVFVYTSTTDPERALVTIALETREPVACPTREAPRGG